jgi:hypothetical protein
MNEARLRELLEAYGADAARWPMEERADATAWLAAHPGALDEALAQARAIDAALALDTRAQAASTDLAARVLAAAPNVVPFRRRQVGGFSMRAVAALAACALVGVALGFGSVGGGGDDLTADADAILGDAFSLGTDG